MSTDNYMSEEDYIRSLIINSYELTNNLLEFDEKHGTRHSIANLCTSINMLARCMDMSPKDMAGCIYNIVCQATDAEQEGGDICEASFSKY